MAVTLIDIDGQPGVRITDAKGKEKAYRLEPFDGGFVLWYSEDGGYTVTEKNGLWRCTCKAWEFNPDRFTTGCKHTTAMRELRKILQTMTAGLH